MNRTLASIAIALLLGASIVLTACASSRTSGPPAGAAAPGLSATDLNGHPFDLADARGKVVLIDFWATWCPPCVQASPHVQALHDAYQDNPDVEIVAVHASSRGDPAAYAAEHGYTYRVIPDGAAIARRWSVNSFPTFIVIDRDGNIAYSKLGYYPGDEAKLERAIQDAL